MTNTARHGTVEGQREGVEQGSGRAEGTRPSVQTEMDRRSIMDRGSLCWSREGREWLLVP